VKALGTYIAVPPSMHPSGRRYAWSVDSAKELADAPEWLLRLIVAPKTNGLNGHASDWAKVLADGADEGKRDVTVTSIAGHLLRCRVSPHVVLELLCAWNTTQCRPPLPNEDITRIVNSICAKELRRRGH
jgi:hypothetical protein